MEWSVRLTEFDIAYLAKGNSIEKTLRAGVLRITQDPEGGWVLHFTEEHRG